MIKTTTDRFNTFDLIQQLFNINLKPEWRRFWEQGWHINLERCDKADDFEWVEEHIEEAEEFFLWHSLMVEFPMENWKAWHNNYLINYE